MHSDMRDNRAEANPAKSCVACKGCKVAATSDFTQTCISRSQCTSDLADLILAFEVRNVLIQLPIGKVLYTAAQQQKFSNNFRLHNIERGRERARKAEPDDQPCD